MKVSLDVDIGVDDSIALLYTPFDPEIEIVSVSVVYSDVEAWLAAEDTMKILDLAEAPGIPAAAGVEKPSCREWGDRVAFIHGKNGLGNVELPPSCRSIRDMDVSRFHMNLAEQYEGEPMIITFDPLTNIARAIREYLGFVHKIRGLVMMGGTLTMRGGVSPVAEASVACDSQAYDQVLTSGIGVTVAGLDVTMRTRLKVEHLDWLSGYCKPACRPTVDYMKQAIIHYLRGNQTQSYYVGNYPLHNSLAVMYTVTPSLVCAENRRVKMECGGTYCRGMIMADLKEHPSQAECARFAMEVDNGRAVRGLMSVFWG